MKKVVKTILKVGGVLAAMDVTDMAAKGQVLNWMREAHPEAAEDFESVDESVDKYNIRRNIIRKFADLFGYLYDNLYDNL